LAKTKGSAQKAAKPSGVVSFVAGIDYEVEYNNPGTGAPKIRC